ncbi:MAG TPA: phosphopantetheine-binding protein, partial [Nitrospiraceae bacterium]
PKTDIEKEVTGLWRSVLRVSDVGLLDNFHALGGDSLAMAVMISEVESAFHINVPIDAFLAAPTVDTIVRIVREAGSPRPATQSSPADASGSPTIKDSFLKGMRNRLCQILALYAPGYTSTRVWLHRARGVSIGKNSSIGLGAIIETAYPSLVSIGDNVTLGMRAIIIGHLRDLTTEARTEHRHTVTLEDDVYVGPGVIILPNVTIGQGAVISAGSVVARSIPPRTLARGNPAVPIAHCGVSLGGGVSYEEFVRNLKPIKDAVV